MQQISIEFRFQEPISLADYKAGTRLSDEVKLSNIDTVPLTVMHGSDDAICPVVMAQKFFGEVASKEKFLVEDTASHYFYAYNSAAGSGMA